MSDTDIILQAFKDHREEVRQDMHQLRLATVKIADAAADMGKAMARSEERHSKHEDAVHRMGRVIDDHENRIRGVEVDHPSMEGCRRHDVEIQEIRSQLLSGRSSLKGGWKVLTVIGALLTGAALLAAVLVDLPV